MFTNFKENVLILLTKFKNTVISVGLIMCFASVVMWRYNTTVIVNPYYDLPTGGDLVLSTFGQSSAVKPTTWLGWENFIYSQKIANGLEGVSWSSDMVQVMKSRCPATCERWACECIVNEAAFAAEWRMYQSAVQRTLATKALESSPPPPQELPSIVEMMGGLMGIGGLMNLLTWLIAIPIALKSIPWCKATATTIFFAIVVVVQATGVWTNISDTYWSDVKVGQTLAELFWLGVGLFFANPIISLVAFGIGLAGGELATRSKGGKFAFGVAAAVFVFAAGALGVFPGWINTLIIIKSGIDQWLATQAMFLGYLLPPGIISLTLGPIWTLVGAFPSMMKGAEAASKI